VNECNEKRSATRIQMPRGREAAKKAKENGGFSNGGINIR